VVEVRQEPFGRTADGDDVARFTLAGPGIEAALVPLGATLTRLRAPDRSGKLGDVVLGFDALDPYLGAHPHFGSTAGRSANRIARGRFRLEGREVVLPTNVGRNHLHGGPRGFGTVLWRAEAFRGDDAAGVHFSYDSPDGDQGYPGRLHTRVTYSIRPPGELRIEFHATADRTTIVNLAHHSYFNLRDGGASDVLAHRLEIAAARYTPVDDESIPTGELALVAGTPLDFRSPHPIGERIAQMAGDPGGYDHNLALDAGGGPEPRFAARLSEPTSGRALEVWTTQPGLQLYTGNYLDGTWIGRGGHPYRRNAGVCLETQHFPDAPNHPAFPSTVLTPHDVYAHTVSYRLSAD
jgi:aldose 1-epimerase